MNIHERLAKEAAASPEATPVRLPSALIDSRLDHAGIARPRVSFIVTNYNYGPYILECLDSVARQTYADWECIVVDDVSTDGSQAAIRTYVAADTSGRFHFLERPQNGGQMEAFRDGLAVATGSFVVMLDADDVLLEDFIEAHLRAHLTVATVAFTSTNQYQINSAGDVIGGQHMDHQSKGYYRHVRKTSFQQGFWIWATSSSMMFRRSTLECIMPTDGTTFRICADYYLAHFCNLIGDSLLVPTIHGCYRRHEKNNFASNPVLGNINSVGDLTKHPPHDLFRTTMIRHVLNNYDRFFPIFMEKGLVNFLLRLVKMRELPRLVRQYPNVFPRSLGHYLRLAYAYSREKRHIPASEKCKIIPVSQAAARD